MARENVWVDVTGQGRIEEGFSMWVFCAQGLGLAYLPLNGLAVITVVNKGTSLSGIVYRVLRME